MPTHADEHQTLIAFGSLSRSDLLGLRKAAAIFMAGTLFSEPTDLIHEALTRCLDGRRHWPMQVPFVVFFANAMRSIADADRNKKAFRFVAFDDYDPHQTEFELSTKSAEDICMQIQEAALIQSRADALIKELCDDPAALAVVSGWMEGLSAKQTISSASISSKQYDAARKRVTRKIASQNQNRRMH